MAKRDVHGLKSDNAKDSIGRIILCDMDDCLCDLTGVWINILNQRHGTSITRDDLSVWHVGRALPFKFPSLDEAKIYEPLDEIGLFRNLPPIEGSKDSLRKMKEMGWRVVIVTSLPSVKHNPGMVVKEKCEWVEEHLFGLVEPRDVIITYQKQLIVGDVLIDDGPHNLENYNGNTIAFDRPWNRKLNPTKRVMHWRNMITACKEIFQGNK